MPEVSSGDSEEPVTRRIRMLGGLVLIVILGAGGLAIPGVGWRLAVIGMKLKGEVPTFGWGELLWNLRPQSPIYLRNLPVVRNPDLAIENKYTSAADSGAGADAFRRYCASCHGLNGRGGGNGPSLAASPSLHSKNDWGLFRSIARGVPGTAMRGHTLPPRTIWQLVAYVRTLRGVGSGALSGPAVRVPFSKLLGAAADATGWYTYSGDYQSHRFSQLDLINRRNVQRLQMVWQYQSSTKEAVIESSPLVVNGVMYVTEPPSGVLALDAADGTLRWRFARLVPDGVALCCGPANRGLAILDSLLYLGTPDAHLVALSARSGRLAWDREVADWRAGYSITGAPLAIKDMVITGVGGGDYGIRGFIAAFKAQTGQRWWQFWTVPSPGERGSETWSGDSWKTGGAPTWLTGSYDPALNLLYWGVGNPAPDFNGEERRGDNLYSNSVVALDADSGRMRWFFQFTPHDEHDWDAAQVPVLFDTDIRGSRRHLLAWANRNAFYYLLDRQTGQFLLARPFARQTWAAGIDSAGRPQALPSARPSSSGSLVYPSVAGATSWWSPSFSPHTGLLYVPVLDASSTVYRRPYRFAPGEVLVGSVAQTSAQTQTGVRALAPLTGVLRWEHRFVPRTESPRMGGILSVAGDLVFIGAQTVLYALDARTGAELWRFNTGGRIVAAPITYVANGKQYLAIAAGRSFMAFGIGAAAPGGGSGSARGAGSPR
jgi:alcohol dehydrogenase (cytochrome c)